MSSPSRADKSKLSCRPCRRLKRKCSRELPSCALCIRLKKKCLYPAPRKEQGPPASPHEAAQQSLETQRAPGLHDGLKDQWFRGQGGYNGIATAQASFPAEFFIDLDFFAPLPHRALLPATAVPPQVQQCLGKDHRAICASYVLGVHTWLPMISPKRLYQAVADFNPDSDLSLALLLLCLKLVTHQGSADEMNNLYHTSRMLLNAIEEAGMMSLHLLQSTILVAVYESGNGIFPGAYLTIGRAARLAALLGLNDRRMTQLLKPADTWTLREEERRTWWAIFILERHINLCPKGLPLVTPQPAWGTLLPITDSRWNEGEIGSSEALFTSGFSSAANVGPYARLCQASHLLGLVLTHRNEGIGKSSERSINFSEALQLEKTLTALDSHLVQQLNASSVSWAFAVDLAISCSAQMTLWNMYACNEPDAVQDSHERLAMETELQTLSIEGLKRLPVERAMRIAQDVRHLDDAGIQRVSPLIVECLYHAATECKWFVRENYDVGMVVALQSLTQALRHVSKHWKVAAQSLALLLRENEAS